MATTRWFLTNIGDGEVLSFDGSPHNIPGMKIFYLKSGGKEERIFEYQGRRYTGKKLEATQNDTIPCTTGCQIAKNPKCECQCGGKNHGIAHKIEANAKGGEDETE